MPRQSTKLARRGFTLIEVLVAVVILSTGIVVVLRAYNSSLIALGQAHDVLQASRLIREQMTDVQAQIRESGEWNGSGVGLLRDPAYRGFYRDCRVDPSGGQRIGIGGRRGSLRQITVVVGRRASGFQQSATSLVYVHEKDEEAPPLPGGRRN
jgi:prepilin-type N-terminal cleavage/methylation domain-containing protein